MKSPRRKVRSGRDALVLLILTIACRPTSGSTAPIGGGGVHEERPGPGPEGVHEREGRAELEVRLRNLVTEHRSRLVPATRDVGACEELCSLATSICGVSEKLCNLADDHPQDEGFQNLCREARTECREAQESCVRCVETHRGDC